MADQRDYMISLINQIAPQYGVPVQLMIAVGMKESGLNTAAVGDGGNSHGAWQIHAPSHPSVSIQQAHDPVFSTNYAAKLLSGGYKKYGNWTDSISSYNSGQPLPNAPASTQAYVKSIAANMSGGQIAGTATGSGGMAPQGALTQEAANRMWQELGLVGTATSKVKMPSPTFQMPTPRASKMGKAMVRLKLPTTKMGNFLPKQSKPYEIKAPVGTAAYRLTNPSKPTIGLDKFRLKMPQLQQPKVKLSFNLPKKGF